MSRKNRGARYVFIVLLVALSLSMAGCLDIVNWGDAADAQPGGEEGTAGQVIVEDAENVTETVSHDVSTSAVRTQHDAQNERVEVRMIEEVDVDHLVVEFGGDASALAQLNEPGDRVVLSQSGIHTAGEARDATRDLYSSGAFDGADGGLSGVSYGDNVEIGVYAVENQAPDLIHQESNELGNSPSAQVDYLFDSTENSINVVLASNTNADYVEVEFSMGGKLAEARLHEPGDEVTIYSDRPKLETRGATEDMIQERLREDIERVSEERRSNTRGSLRETDLRLDEILSQLSSDEEIPTNLKRSFDVLSVNNNAYPSEFDDVLDDRADTPNIFDEEGVTEVGDTPDADNNDTDTLRGLISELEQDLEEAESDLSPAAFEDLRNDIRSDISQLRSIERDLTFADAEDVTLSRVNSAFLKYRGPMDDTGTVDEYTDVLANDVFDQTVRGEDIVNDLDLDAVEGQYRRPAPDELVDIQATAVVEPSRSDSGIRQRGGTDETILDVSGSIESGSAEVGTGELEDIGAFAEDTENLDAGTGGGGSVSLPTGPTSSNSEDNPSGTEGVSSASIDTDELADLIQDSLNQVRANDDSSFYNGEFNSDYHLTKAAEDYSERMSHNIDENEELSSIRSGSVPAQPTDTNTAIQYIESGATECAVGSPSGYSEGSSAVIVVDALEGFAVSGEVERAGTSSTRIKAEGAAPVTVPNYALPFYDPTSDWRGEMNVDAYVYDDLVDGDASETEVADAIVEEWTDNGEFMDAATDSSYSNQGVGVAVDEPTGVIYVTQSLC